MLNEKEELERFRVWSAMDSAKNTHFVRGSIIVQLSPCSTGLDSTEQVPNSVVNLTKAKQLHQNK